MADYKITLSTDGKHTVDFFTYNEEKTRKENKDFKLTKIKGETDALMPATNIRIFAPDDIEIIEANEYGVFLGHKCDEKSAKEQWEDTLRKYYN